MIIGGALNVMAETGAIHAFMGHVVKKMEGHETLIIPVLLPIFICLSERLAAAKNTLLLFRS